MRDLPHLAGRLFNTPLLVDERKLDGVVPAFLRRIEGKPDDPDPDEQRNPGEPTITATGIAVIPVIGSLVRRKTGLQAFSGLTSYADIDKSLQCALDDARVRAILLQIDSYGGEAGGCFELCNRIYKARGPKPIWASADIYALSGGYAIASCADQLFVAPSGELGSIGVVAVHCETSRANDAMGITYTVLRSGKRKADGNRFEPLAPEAEDRMQAAMDATRDKFARTVSRNRSGASLRAIMGTEGAWLDPDEAMRLGLADGIATYADVFASLVATLTTGARVSPAPPEPLAPDPEDEPEEDAGVTAAKEIIMPDKPDATTETKPEAKPAEAVSGAATPPTNVVDIDKMRAEGASQYAAQVSEISDMCMLAGRTDLLPEMLSKKISVADARKQLIDAKASADAKIGELSNHRPAGSGDAPVAAHQMGPAAAEQLWDKVWATK